MNRILQNSLLLLKVKGPVAAARYVARAWTAGDRLDVLGVIVAVSLCALLVAAVEPVPQPAYPCSTDTECEEMFEHGMDEGDDQFYNDGGDWSPCRPFNSNIILVRS